MEANIGYLRPSTLVEAQALLAEKKGKVTILAGGTDVMVDLREGKLHTSYLLDVSRLAEMKGITLQGDELRIGAAVTLTEIQQSPIIAEYAPVLRKCTLNFASRQIRNVGTLGGNVAHCSPCGDTVPALVIHEAEAILSSSRGERRIPMEQVATGPYQCLLPQDELIVAFILKPRKVEFADFHKIGRRKDLAISRLSLALMLDRDTDGTVNFMRVSLGACTPTPHRMSAVEEFLVGKKLSKEVLFAGGKLLAEKMIEITGRRSSIIYKEPAVQGLFVKMLYPVI